MTTKSSLLLDLKPKDILRARLVVARLGETNLNRWWRTEDLLGEMGQWVAKRTLPKTHATGRARMAITVARHACDQRFRSPEALHLFRLDSEAEDRLDLFLSQHLDDADLWDDLLGPLEALTMESVVGDTLVSTGVARKKDVATVAGVDLGPAGRSLRLPAPSDAQGALRLLTAGFARSQPGELAVPYFEKGQLS